MRAYTITITYQDPHNLFPDRKEIHLTAMSKEEASLDAYIKFSMIHYGRGIKNFEIESVKQIRMWVDNYVIQERWFSWEDSTSTLDYQEARADFELYRKHSRAFGGVRMVTRRILNPLLESAK